MQALLNSVLPQVQKLKTLALLRSLLGGQKDTIGVSNGDDVLLEASLGRIYF